jgi:hypothetical protein
MPFRAVVKSEIETPIMSVAVAGNSIPDSAAYTTPTSPVAPVITVGPEAQVMVGSALRSTTKSYSPWVGPDDLLQEGDRNGGQEHFITSTWLAAVGQRRQAAADGDDS